MIKITIETENVISGGKYKPEKYIRFDWEGGYIKMKKSRYERLSKRKKDLIWDAGISS